MQPPPIKHEWTHNDGTLVTIRPIRPEDRDIERAFVRDLSSNSSYFRFLSIVKDLSPQSLDKFTQVDYPRERALFLGRTQKCFSLPGRWVSLSVRTLETRHWSRLARTSGPASRILDEQFVTYEGSLSVVLDEKANIFRVRYLYGTHGRGAVTLC
jgi:hypothetical protein